MALTAASAAGMRGDARNTLLHGRGADSSFVRACPFALGSIDNQRHFAILQKIDQIRMTFGEFLHAFDLDAGFFQPTAVPSVASISKPSFDKPHRPCPTTCSLCRLRDADKDLARYVGRTVPAASWLLANAIENRSLTPITSPVLRISGPSTISTPANLRNGNTLSFTETCAGIGSSVIPVRRASSRP